VVQPTQTDAKAPGRITLTVRALIPTTAFLALILTSWGARSATVTLLDKEYSPVKNVPLNMPGEYVFHFRPEKNQEMTLLLEVQRSRGEPDRQKLTNLQLTIEATVQNQTGRTVCHAVGSPKNDVGADGADNWVLMTIGDEAAFWKRNCAEMKLNHSESYLVTIRVRDVDPKTPKIEVTPIFERSDNYVP
jgi:hypothetical protein